MDWLSKQFCANNVCTGSYQITNMGNSMAIGTFAHASGHLILGLPDLYVY